MTTITIPVHRPADCLPDADTDVLVWESGEEEAQLGALYRTCPLEWVNAQGAPIRSVVAWAELPLLVDPPKADLVADMRAKLERPCCGTLHGSQHRATCEKRKQPNV